MKKFLIADAFAIAYALAFEMTYQSGPSESRTSFFWMGLVFGGLCVVSFFSAGSRYLTFSSVFSYAQLVFIASPAVLIGMGQQQLREYLAPSSTLIFLSLCFAIQVAIFGFSPSLGKRPLLAFSFQGHLVVVALALAILAFVPNLSGATSTLGFALEPLTLAAIVISGAVTFSQTKLGPFAFYGFWLLTIVGTFVMFRFTGYGRLEFASYMLTLGVLFSWMTSHYWTKIMILVATVPGLLILTLRRVEYVVDIQGRQTGVEQSLGSAFGPFQSGAYILQQSLEGAISPTRGESFLTSLLFWVPRAVWPEKPVGFGRAIVPVTQPELEKVLGHSDAAPFIAEFVWDFGMLGLLLAVPLIFLMVKGDYWVSDHLLRTQEESGDRARALLFASLATIVGMLPNYVWGGSFPYFARGIIPVAVLLGLYYVQKRSNGRDLIVDSPPSVRSDTHRQVQHRNSNGKVSGNWKPVR